MDTFLKKSKHQKTKKKATSPTDQTIRNNIAAIKGTGSDKLFPNNKTMTASRKPTPPGLKIDKNPTNQASENIPIAEKNNWLSRFLINETINKWKLIPDKTIITPQTATPNKKIFNRLRIVNFRIAFKTSIFSYQNGKNL